MRAYAAVLVLVSGAIADRAASQPCTPGSTTPCSEGRVRGDVFDLLPYQPANGPSGSLACGRFTIAGGLPATRIALWDGSWRNLGAGLGVNPNDTAYSMAMFDEDGPGPANPVLIVGGDFTQAGTVPANRVARWDGNSWSAVGSGTNNTVRVLLVHDDGSGPALFAGGFFTSAGAGAANYIAKWDGVAWAPLGAGLNGAVRTMVAVDEGGPRPLLYVGGDFTSAAGNPARVAKWDGTAWSPVGNLSFFLAVRAMAVFDGGTGPRVYIGGAFDGFVASLQGQTWQTVPNGPDGTVSALCVRDPDGPGPMPNSLYAGGSFDHVGGQPPGKAARFDGANWFPVGSIYSTDTVFTLESLDLDGPGPEADSLVAAGTISQASGIAAGGVVRLSGTAWQPFGGGTAAAIEGQEWISDLAVFDVDGSGPALPELYVAGRFRMIGGLRTALIARWNGARWLDVSGGLDTIGDEASALCVFNDGSGTALYVGGNFRRAGTSDPQVGMLRWRGSGWEDVGANAPGAVRALQVYDDGNGPALYAGGTLAPRMFKWDGLQWQPLGTGIGGSLGATEVRALTVFDDDGPGPRPPGLYVGGYFETAGELPARGIARWDAGGWSTLGSGVLVSEVIDALIVHNDGSGNALYIGGAFSSVSGVPAQNVARWNGSLWAAVGGGVNGSSGDFAVFDDGSGPALFGGGVFASGGTLYGFARWNGGGWTYRERLYSGNYAGIHSLQVIRESDLSPGGLRLAAAGIFESLGNVSAGSLALWGGCAPSCYANCDGSTSLPLLNVNDFVCFQSRFAAADPYADCDHSNTRNVLDFVCFQQQFAAGCP